MNAIILPYKNGSRSGAALANALGLRQIRLAGSTINRQRGKRIINWGNSGRNLPPQGLGRHHTLINSLEAVSAAANKLNTFNLLYNADVRIPEYTTDFETAYSWMDEDSSVKVVERHQLTGHSGAGIVIAEDVDALSDSAPLYVKYVKKQEEYRVHIMAGEVIDVQRKARRSDVPDEDVNWQVRNHQNGFCYMRENVNPDADVIQQALNAIDALRLDFGAVDVIWNNRQSKAYVLEVNTACGLEGTTLERYKVAFQELLMTGEVTPLEGYEYSEEEVEDEEPLDDTFASDETYAIVSDEMVTEALQMPARDLQVGDRVRIASSSQFYGRTWSSNNPSDITGTVDSVRNTDSLPVDVMWDNGQTNIYNFHDLELSDEGVVQEEQGSVSDGATDTQGQPRLNKWLVSVDGSVNLEEGVFDTQEEAEMAIVSPDFHNMRQLGHDVRVVSL